MSNDNIGVDAVDGIGEDVTADDIAEEVAELREMLKQVEDNPEEVLSVGVVVAFTGETTQTNPDGQVAEGMAMRLLNPTAHEGYRDVGSLLRDAQMFDEKLEQMKLATEEPQPQPDLSDLLGM